MSIIISTYLSINYYTIQKKNKKKIPHPTNDMHLTTINDDVYIWRKRWEWECFKVFPLHFLVYNNKERV